MGLSCSCDDWYPEAGDTYISHVKHDKVLSAKTWRKCVACGVRINPGDMCHEIVRVKCPDTEIECRIYGEDGEIPRASHYWCEECGDLHEAVEDLGFCSPVTDNPRHLINELRQEYMKGE